MASASVPNPGTRGEDVLFSFLDQQVLDHRHQYVSLLFKTEHGAVQNFTVFSLLFFRLALHLHELAANFLDKTLKFAFPVVRLSGGGNRGFPRFSVLFPPPIRAKTAAWKTFVPAPFVFPSPETSIKPAPFHPPRVFSGFNQLFLRRCLLLAGSRSISMIILARPSRSDAACSLESKNS